MPKFKSQVRALAGLPWPNLDEEICVEVTCTDLVSIIAAARHQCATFLWMEK